MVRLLLVPLLALCACATLQGRADELASQGQYIEAASIYDHLVQKKPGDQMLVNARDDLRWKGLEQLLGRARRLRFEGKDDDAEHFLDEFLSYRNQWNTKLNGGLESSLADEFDGTYLHFRKIILEPAQQGLALTAEEALGQKRSLLSHAVLSKVRREMEGAVVQGGQATCARVKQLPSEGSPHWNELVVRYCRHFHASGPTEPSELRELLQTPVWSVALSGVSGAQQELLAGRLSRVFESSAWYSPLAARQPDFALRGRFTEDWDQRTVQLTAPWVDREPYTDHEERTEVIEEPYEENEEYTDDQGNKKTRKVTRIRKKTREYTVPVTKYRDVHKTFEYSAQRHSVTYGFSIAAGGVLSDRHSAVVVARTDQYSAYGFEHDVSFSPGHVSPQRPDLTLPHEWFSQNALALEQSFAGQLRESWRQYYCSEPSFSLETAARCARAGVALPAHASQVLSDVLGSDGPRTPVLFSSGTMPAAR
ncbi:hypothetical protein [Stigmatella aurantiaca]|uniref:Conserved uncharacterized protein n=3 Tax=Stigmatella aurantiaca TaxID=41 RepID=E3FSU7_STIAD|nr:hypothetical protein [Stigmatella aurantiaca]ADO74571.1 conserved uncharacterized protein [Stigmatella aurantiaca DW4/3-1]